MLAKIIAITLALFAGIAYADKIDPVAAQALAEKSGCFACHAIDKKISGPAYKEVAERYKDDKNAEATLTERIRKGSEYEWGEIPMPPNTQLKDEEVKILVRWVLSLK
jgi:cytochrome c